MEENNNTSLYTLLTTQYSDQIKTLTAFLAQLEPYRKWFAEAEIELYAQRELLSCYRAYLLAYAEGTDEFRSFHKPEWFSLAKEGKLAAVLGHPSLELIQFHFHCGGSEGNNHYFGLCREPAELLMLVETPFSPTAFENACEYLIWVYGYREDSLERRGRKEKYVFSATRLFKDAYDSEAAETNLRLLYYTYSFNHTTGLSLFKTQLSPSKALSWLNYGIRLVPKHMRFTDDQQYLPEKESLTVRELMAFLIEKLPLQCVELVAYSERYPFGYLHIVNELFRNGKPDGVIVGNEEWLSDLPIRPASEISMFGTVLPEFEDQRPNAGVILFKSQDWSFSFAYPGSYIPVELLGQFKLRPMMYKTLREKHEDLVQYESKAKIITERSEIDSAEMWKEMQSFESDSFRESIQESYIRDGVEDEIY